MQVFLYCPYEIGVFIIGFIVIVNGNRVYFLKRRQKLIIEKISLADQRFPMKIRIANSLKNSEGGFREKKNWIYNDVGYSRSVIKWLYEC